MEACSCGIPSWAQGYGIPESRAASNFQVGHHLPCRSGDLGLIFDQKNKCLDFHWQTDSGLTIFFLPVQKAPLKVQLPATAEVYLD